MIKKLKKHVSILKRIVAEKKSMQILKQQGNPLVHSILETFNNVRGSKFTSQELELFQRLEQHRKNMMVSNQQVTYEIFNLDMKRIVKHLAKSGLTSPVWCRFHYLIAKNLQAKNYLEIGTSMGISGSYILSAIHQRPDSHFVTMEGLPSLCEIARNQFGTIASADKFDVIQGLYDQTFPQVLGLGYRYNIVLIDGNHQKEPTLEYFKLLKGKISNPAVLIFDDINWSRGMQEAWKIIKEDPDVNYTIDLYKLGLVVIDHSDPNRNINADLFMVY